MRSSVLRVLLAGLAASFVASPLLANEDEAPEIGGTGGQLAPSRTCTNLLVVYGEVFDPGGQTHWPDGSTVTIENLDRGYVLDAAVGATESGFYEVVFLDPPNNDVACVGDDMAFSVNGISVNAKVPPVVTAGGVASCLMKFDLVVPPPTNVESPDEYLTSWSVIKAVFVP